MFRLDTMEQYNRTRAVVIDWKTRLTSGELTECEERYGCPLFPEFVWQCEDFERRNFQSRPYLVENGGMWWLFPSAEALRKARRELRITGYHDGWDFDLTDERADAWLRERFRVYLEKRKDK